MPWPSRALTWRRDCPAAVTVQVAAQVAQVRFESGGFTTAADQVRPPSALISTVLMPRFPAKATPEPPICPALRSEPSGGESMRDIVLTAASGFQPWFSQYPLREPVASSM